MKLLISHIVKIGDPADIKAYTTALLSKYIFKASLVRNTSAVISDPKNNPQKILFPNKQAIAILNPAGRKIMKIYE
jgi:hypothetical protein|tara:strand:+ start:221 stop:448 length:228 start_codon:yes stop_codon:yes gene_type:complete